ELELIEDIDPPYKELEAAYNEIAVQIRTTMSLENINNRLGEHRELHTRVIDVLEEYTQVQEDSIIESPLNQEETKKGSSRDDQIGTHYKYTKKQLSNKLDTSRASLNGFQKSSKRRLEDKTEGVEQGDRSKSKEGKQTSEPKDAQTLSEDLVLETGLQHITLKQALNAATERFRENMPIDPRPMNWNDFVEASYKLKADLHISQQAWANACVTLGRTGASICVLLTDHATQRADDPVRKPAGYFNAMINRAKTGELKLHKSIFGILKREGETEV
ncbi:MAG: hypothetical protein JKY63_04780, partial [Rhodobiaceae bacterium]|nr:hypothetical protein [Rhodobiaceae bacterium]